MNRYAPEPGSTPSTPGAAAKLRDHDDVIGILGRAILAVGRNDLYHPDVAPVVRLISERTPPRPRDFDTVHVDNASQIGEDCGRAGNHDRHMVRYEWAGHTTDWECPGDQSTITITSDDPERAFAAGAINVTVDGPADIARITRESMAAGWEECRAAAVERLNQIGHIGSATQVSLIPNPHPHRGA